MTLLVTLAYPLLLLTAAVILAALLLTEGRRLRRAAARQAERRARPHDSRPLTPAELAATRKDHHA